MSKNTHNKRQQTEKTPTSRENHLASAQPGSGEVQRGRFIGKVSAPDTNVAEHSRPSHEQIALRAYHLWEAHGRPAGTDQDDWFQAERLLREES